MHLPELSVIHDRFLSLSHLGRDRFGESLGGKLLLRSQLDADGIAAVVAGSVAGAASLCVDDNAERLREGLRAGFVDFVVAHLDEALRILKNEIRRARPVSVGLTADAETSINAMIERGLQPNLLFGVPQDQSGILIGRGAIALPENATRGLVILAWTVAENPAQVLPRIAGIAAESIDSSRQDTAARRRWLEQSPRYLGRSFATRQCLRMTDAEIAGLLPRLQAEFPAAKIARGGQPV